MRVIICGDTHIGAIFGLGGSNGRGGNTRVDDYEKTLNHIVEHAIDTGADAFIQTGDAFESRTPSPEYMGVMDRALKRLSMANITSVVIMGNHDYRSSGVMFSSAISSLGSKDLPNVRIVLDPQVLTLVNDKEEGVNIALIPYRDKKMYSGISTEEISKEYDKHVRQIVSSGNLDYPTIAVGHNFFYEGSYTSYSGTEILTNLSAFENCDLVAMGHLHQFRIVNKKKPVAIYTGSMERLNFGDKNIEKYFIDYNTSSKKVKIIKSPIRDLYDGILDLSDYELDSFKESVFEELKKIEVENKVVRIKLLIKERAQAAIKRSEVEKFLYDQGAFYVSKVLVETVFQRTVRDDIILKEKDDYSMFKAFVEKQTLDEDIREKILIESKKIMV